jgi:hypothetical protein
MATKINTNQINTNSSARFTSDAEIGGLASIASVAAALIIKYSDTSNWSAGYTVYTFTTPRSGQDIVNNDTIGRRLRSSEYSVTTTALTLVTAAQPNDEFTLIGPVAQANANQALPNNLIQGEGSLSPTFIVVPSDGASVNVSESLVANTDSPYFSQLPNKRRITNIYTSGASAYNSNILPITWTTSNTTVGVGRWVKDSDAAAAYLGGTNAEVWFYDTGVGAIIFDVLYAILTVNAAIGNSQTGTGSNSYATGYSWSVTCLDKQNGYSFIAINIFNVVYGGGYTPGQMRFYDIYNTCIPNTWTKIDYAGMVFLLNTKVISSSVYPDGNNILQWPPCPLSNNAGIMALNSEVAANGKKFTVTINGAYTYIRTSYNTIYDIVTTMFADAAANTSLTFYGQKLILKTDPTSASGIVLNGGTGDDSAPTKVCNSYMYGRHGNSAILMVVVTAHGKTVADVGSRWVDGASHNFYIISIIDANTLWMVSDNTGSASNWVYYVTISGNLTYGANAVHTGNMTVASYAQDQMLPSTKNVVITILLDGNVITANGVYPCNKPEMIEAYDGVDFNLAITGLISGRPGGGYTIQPALNIAGTAISVQNYYNFQDQNKCLIFFKWNLKETINLIYFGGTQSANLVKAPFTSCKRYMPNVLPISDGVTTWDFRTPSTLPTYPSGFNADMNVTSAYWEDGTNPPSRAVDMLTNGSNLNVNFNIGALPFGIGTKAGRIANVLNAWFLASNVKLYPYVLDGNKLNSGGVTAPVVKQGAMFRGFCDKPTNQTNFIIFAFGTQWYVLIDWHTVINDQIILPDYMLGKPISIYKNSSNVTLVDTVVTGVLDVTVASASPQYGYLELIIG